MGKRRDEDEEQVVMEEILKSEMDEETKNLKGDDEVIIQDD